jgi:lactate dehydrogenase-like 2-hydroxyacid dehydrogenase
MHCTLIGRGNDMTPASRIRPRILVTRRHMPAVEERLARDYDAVRSADDRRMGVVEVLAAADGMDALFVCTTEPLDAAAMAALPASVRAVLTLSVGTDHLDLAAAKARGVAVLATPDVLTDATAEIAMLLLLGAARGAHSASSVMRRGDWLGFSPTGFIGKDVTGGRLGIFGMGRIGRAVARNSRGFGMDVHYHNRRRLDPEQEAGATYHANARDLLAVSDFLILSAPSTPETRGFLDAAAIAALPDGAVVVNVGRGNLVDDDALIAALGSGKLFAAGLDVYNGEPRNVAPGYFDLPNAFLLPHLGSAAEKARTAMGMIVLDGLDALLAGRPVPNRVA